MTSRGRISSVLFDLDDTLIDRSAAFVRYCKSLYANTPSMRKTHSESEAVAILVYLDGRGLNDREAFIVEALNVWPDVFPSVDEAVISWWSTYPKFVELEAATIQLLSEIRASGRPVGIVTNGASETQRAKLRLTGLEDMVDGIVVSGEHDFRKPDAAMFEQALSLISAEPATTLFVGDNAEADILGALNLGMQTAWMHLGREWPHPQDRPHHMLENISDVRKIVFG